MNASSDTEPSATAHNVRAGHAQTSAEPSQPKPASKWFTVIATAIMPLFFMVLLTATFVGASHNPTPHNLSLVLAGDNATTAQLSKTLDAETGAAFEVTATINPAEARAKVAGRSAVGAVIISPESVTVVTASAGGVTAAAVVGKVGAEIAAVLGVPVVTENAAPLAEGDATGAVLVFLFVACTVGGFLVIIGPSQVRTRLRTREMLTICSVGAVLIPMLAFAMISVFVGDFGATWPTLNGMLGIAMLYTFTVGLIATVCHQLIGTGGVFVVMIVVVALNIPSSGGPTPAAMLPPFWQGLHSFWFGAGGFEAMRSVLYFGGAATGAWLTQLLVWTGAALVVVLVVGFLRSRHGGPIAHSTLDRELEAAAGAGVAGAAV